MNLEVGPATDFEAGQEVNPDRGAYPEAVPEAVPEVVLEVVPAVVVGSVLFVKSTQPTFSTVDRSHNTVQQFVLPES